LLDLERFDFDEPYSEQVLSIKQHISIPADFIPSFEKSKLKQSLEFIPNEPPLKIAS
jgi:hypothetical protein